MLLRVSKFLLAAATVGLLANCTSDDTVATTNEFSSLPEVTGPVSQNASSSFSSALTAVTGVRLSTVDSTVFTAGKSVQMCENVNLLKEVLREASNPDNILCYMGKMKSTGVLPGTLNIADGAEHYIKLINLPGGGGGNTTPNIKFQIVKTAGAISSFKMWSCFAGTSGSPVQSEYISQAFSGTTATVTSKYTGSENTQSFGSSLTATGTFDGGWTTKNISGNRYWSDSGTSSSNSTTINMDQFADQLKMQIAQGGTYGTQTMSNRFYAEMQLLGTTVNTIAIGDGSAKAVMSWDDSGDGNGAFTNSATVSWNGDTRLNLGTASDGPFYATANAGTVPSAASPTPVTFSGAEAWDCSLPGGQTWVEADFDDGGTAIVTGMSECDDKGLSNSNWVNCPYF